MVDFSSEMLLSAVLTESTAVPCHSVDVGERRLVRVECFKASRALLTEIGCCEFREKGILFYWGMNHFEACSGLCM